MRLLLCAAECLICCFCSLSASSFHNFPESSTRINDITGRHWRSAPWCSGAEQNIIVGNGKLVSVSFYGGLDVILHSNVEGKGDIKITLTDIAVVPELAFNTISFNRMQERELIIFHAKGAAMMDGRINFAKYPQGKFIEATRIVHDDARLAARCGDAA